MAERQRCPMGRTSAALRQHEAAHALVAERFGCRVLWLRAGQPGDPVGSSVMQLGRIPKSVGPLQMACILTAGSVAEALRSGIERGAISADDLERIKAMGIRGEDFRIIWEETERLVSALRGDIRALAADSDLVAGRRVKRGPPAKRGAR